MQIQTFEIPARARDGYEAPSITALQPARDGTVLCGTLFATPSLARLRVPALASAADAANLGADANGKAELVEDYELEAACGGDVLGVLRGLRQSTSGATAVSVLQAGMLPSLLRGFSGKEVRGKTGAELVEFLLSQDGGMGAALRHAVAQISEGQVNVRRSKESGVLWDVAHIGDYIFGLTRSAIWREPYLNPEKRETMRSDLNNNFALHRDADGNFWFLGQNQRLFRMAQTDIKAKPTPLKIPGTAGLFLSASSQRDTWMYASCGDNGDTLVRIRRNPVSFEEEIQTVAQLGARITGLCVLEAPTAGEAAARGVALNASGLGQAPDTTDSESGDDTVALSAAAAPNILVIALEDAESARLMALDLIATDDPETIAPAPAIRELGRVPSVACVTTLTLDPYTRSPVLWAGEGRVGGGRKGSAAPRLIRIFNL